MTGRYRAVLFDLYGTLVDFRTTYSETLASILADHGMLDRAEFFMERWQSFVFQGVQQGTFITVRRDFEESLARVLAELGVEGDLSDYCHNVIDSMFDKLHVADVFPEVPGVLGRLEAEGIQWAVVSNVDEDDLHTILGHHDLHPTVTVSSERARSYKPEAGPFEKALRELGMAPKEVCHVGDSPIADVAGAVKAGIDAVWVNRYEEAYPEDVPRPRWHVADLRSLPELINEG